MIEPAIGGFFSTLLNGPSCTDPAMLEPPVTMQRTDFFSSQPADGTLSEYAHLFETPEFRTYHTGGIYTGRLRDALLVGTDGVVAYEGQILRDSIVHLMYWAAGSQVDEYRQAEWIRLKQPLQATRQIVGQDCMIGFTGSWRNYAHWMQECLPKLFVFKVMQQSIPALRLVLPAFERRSYQQQTLDLLQIGADDLITVDASEILGFDSVRVVSNVDLWGVPPFAKRAADFLTQRIDQAGAKSIPRASRIYIHRDRGARRVSNFDAVRGLLMRHGFMVAVFDDMALSDQINTMRGARHVVGEHGAGLVNEMFCPQPSAVLELFNPACVQPAFWSLASACGSRFGYVIGNHDSASAERPSWNTDYVVPLAELDRAITRMLALPLG